MEQVEVKVKKWGNSFGVILPMKVVEREKLREGSDITLNIRAKKVMTVGDLMELSGNMGWAKKLKNVDTAKELKRIDKELWPEDE